MDCVFVGRGSKVAQWLGREFADRKIRGLKPTSASRLLSRFGQPSSIPALVLPSGGMAARQRKGTTTGRLLVNWAKFFENLFIKTDFTDKFNNPENKVILFDKYTHLQINLVFTEDSAESLVYDILQLNVLHKGCVVFQLVRYSRYRSIFS
ncbi:hypothetical protein CSKR_103768 [Clonorchis sinensis]|uniref:Uncharacterized protein n=1 Tax=Clonorchis sinensis TaxID=79923 RepID=A0A419PY27_CLOSI|nr:hypothetical protein CSKR_103768 [Clonorchis sinensis]